MIHIIKMNEMNETSVNYTTYTYYDLEYLLRTYGSTWTLDILNLTVFTAVSVIGLILNLFGLVVFLDKSEFNIPLYQYIRVSLVANSILCLASVFNFLATSYRLIAWSNSYWTQAYYNYVYSCIINLSYFYVSVLDIVILLDRIANFDKRFKTWFKLSPYTICIVIFVICALIDSPYYFVFMPGSFTAYLDRNTTFTIWFANTTPFAQSPVGRIVNFTLCAVRDGLVMIIHIVLNIISIHMLKNHLRKKKRITQGPGTLIGNVTFLREHLTNSTEQVVVNKMSSKDAAAKADLNATLMVIIMCILSICAHVFTLTMILYSNLHFNLLVFILYFIGDFFLPLKAMLDFFLLLRFNKKFKQISCRLLKLGGK